MSITAADNSVRSSPHPRRPASVHWSWRTAITEWERWVRLNTRSPNTTIRTRREHLQLLAKTAPVGPWDMTEEHLLEWFADRDWKPNTYLSRRTTMRHFFGAYAVTVGKLDRSPALAIPTVKPPEPNPTPAPDRVYDEALRDAPERTRKMLILAAGHGLRRAEVAQVWPERDLIEDLDGWSLLVHGKGGKEQIVPLEPEAAAMLRAAPPGYLFPGQIDGHLAPQTVGILVSRALEGAWTMHKLRHRAATYFLEDADNDIRVVQDLLGHASVNTTMLYVPANRDRMRNAVRGGRSSTRAMQDRRAAPGRRSSTPRPSA
ncbi:tyrosine-type recombinase/integrase [Nocardioides sp. WV_118_6]